MTSNNPKQGSAETPLGADRSGKRSRVRSGYINFGSHLDPYDSLSARIRAEIDRRLCLPGEDTRK